MIIEIELEQKAEQWNVKVAGLVDLMRSSKEVAVNLAKLATIDSLISHGAFPNSIIFQITEIKAAPVEEPKEPVAT